MSQVLGVTWPAAAPVPQTVSNGVELDPESSHCHPEEPEATKDPCSCLKA